MNVDERRSNKNFTMNWQARIQNWRERFEIQLRPPLPQVSAREVLSRLDLSNDDLLALYGETNGIALGHFNLLPILDERDAQRTWDDIVRANDLTKSRFLNRDAELFRRFVVFADMGVGRAGLIDRNDGTVW